MRKLLVAAALSLCGISANAAGIYVLSDFSSYNQFTGFLPSPVTGTLPLAGTAVVDGAGNVSITGLQFSGDFGPGGTFEYTNGNWTTTVGGTSIANSGTCVEVGGTACSSPLSGFASLGGSAVFDTALTNDGSLDTSVCPPVGLGAGPCNAVSIVEDPGNTLVITEQSEFFFPDTPTGYQFTFTVIPVPAAVWLFGSALGLLGWIRRKAS